MARLAPTGALAPGFDGGIQTTHLDLEHTAFNDLAVTASAVTVAGWSFGELPGTPPASDGLVVRYRHDGRLDESFGDGGAVLVDFRGGGQVVWPPDRGRAAARATLSLTLMQ